MYPSDTPRASCQLTCRLQVEWRSSSWTPVTAEGTEHRYIPYYTAEQVKYQQYKYTSIMI